MTVAGLSLMMKQADKGVSSAIATVLMVAIVVVLAAAISASFFDVAEDLREPAPNVADTTGKFVAGSSPDKQIVQITHESGDNVAVAEIEIIVRASGSGADLPTEARLVDLPAEGQFMTNNIDGNSGLIDSRSSTANIIEDDSSNVWAAGDTIRFRIGVGSADFRDPPPSYNTDKKSDVLEVIIVHTPSNSILAEHTFTPQ
jgi:flagellin-like protein